MTIVGGKIVWNAMRSTAHWDSIVSTPNEFLCARPSQLSCLDGNYLLQIFAQGMY